MEQLNEKKNNSPVKVLQVFASLNVGGAESRMMDVFRNIDREAYQFTFLSMESGKQFYEEEILSLNGKIVKVESPRKSGVFKNIHQLRKVLNDGKYDVVHAHTSFHAGIVMFVGWLEKIPVRIVHARTTNLQKNTLKNRLALFVGKFLIKMFATERLAVSKDSGQFLFGRTNFTVIPNAIDCAKYFNTSTKEVERLKEKFNLEMDFFCIGMVGRFYAMKNHAFAIDVFAEYLKKYKNAYLILIGDGQERDNIQQKAMALEVDDKVIFTGIQSNINEWMKLLNVVLLPSTFEGLPGVVLEAQAAGTPVLMSDVVTNEVDMKINLVRRLPITEGTEIWVSALESIEKIQTPTMSEIEKAFDLHGFSLTSEIDKLTNFYKCE